MKKKILIISDHALYSSGVATQTKYLIAGLIKTGKFKFLQLGAAIKHENLNTVKVNDDFIILPINGFGDRKLIRSVLIEYKPDALILFTDPRFFNHIFEMEDEIHQICPILYWHVWDNRPTPYFNKSFLESIDAINCHSYLTYMMCKEMYPEKTNFIPHAVPKSIFYKLDEESISKNRESILGKNKDKFVFLWINRNCKRKRAADLLHAWKLFDEKVKSLYGKNDSVLIMHTDPKDREGYNLIELNNYFKTSDTVLFSVEKVDANNINILHNISDCFINISCNEGFGLGTLESMMCGNPIIAAKTGGLIRQVINHKDHSINGICLDIDFTTIVGNQEIPILYEDYVSIQKVSDAFFEMYKKDKQEIKEIGDRAMNYVHEEFDYDKTINLWSDSLNYTIENWKKNYKRFEVLKI